MACSFISEAIGGAPLSSGVGHLTGSMSKERKALLLKWSSVLLLPVTIWLGYSSLNALLSARDARDISQQIGSARQAIEKLPPGVGRPEEFVRRLRSINPGRAPQEVKVALTNYVAAMEQATDALKHDKTNAVLEQTCAQRAKELTEAITRNQ